MDLAQVIAVDPDSAASQARRRSVDAFHTGVADLGFVPIEAASQQTRQAVATCQSHRAATIAFLDDLVEASWSIRLVPEASPAPSDLPAPGSLERRGARGLAPNAQQIGLRRRRLATNRNEESVSE